ncbi:uncharacterized protein LOC110097320 [Dendrobium catenatum]|uniref:uncharacterized protein LOC110097320 n=1 Tax=Dendrobium catenatum TaxID=906689 RepID=UPI00109FE8CD|nr:uncharacterized protein LOC110097320 [Dendrobium catenatum]
MVPRAIRSNIGNSSLSSYDCMPEWKFYKPFVKAIKARADFSQTAQSTLANEFAKEAVADILWVKNVLLRVYSEFLIVLSESKPASEDETSRSTNNASKLILGSVVVGAAVIEAYQTGYVKLHVKDDNFFLRTSNLDTIKVTTDSKLPADKEILHSADKEIFLSSEITSQVKPNAENVETSETNNGCNFKVNTGISETIPIQEESAPYREEKISISVENATAAPVEKALSSEESSKELLNKDRSITIINSNQEESRTTEGSMEQMEDLVDRSLHHLKDADAKVSDFYQDTRPKCKRRLINNMLVWETSAFNKVSSSKGTSFASLRHLCETLSSMTYVRVGS